MFTSTLLLHYKLERNYSYEIALVSSSNVIAEECRGIIDDKPHI